jgi:protein ImuA
MRCPTDIDRLRGRIAAIERTVPETAQPAVATGFAAIDRHLPVGGLRPGRLHDILAAPGHHAAASGFTARLAARFAAALAGDGGEVLWCLRRDDLHAPGLLPLSLDPARLIVAWCARDEDLLWSMEEGLRCSAVAAVIGDCRNADALAQRRLQLAAEAGGGAGLMLREAVSGALVLNTPDSRWRIAAAPSPAPPLRPGHPPVAWHVRLERLRGVQPAEWVVVDGETAGNGSGTERPQGDMTQMNTDTHGWIWQPGQAAASGPERKTG